VLLWPDRHIDFVSGVDIPDGLMGAGAFSRDLLDAPQRRAYVLYREDHHGVFPETTLRVHIADQAFPGIVQLDENGIDFSVESLRTNKGHETQCTLHQFVAHSRSRGQPVCVADAYQDGEERNVFVWTGGEDDAFFVQKPPARTKQLRDWFPLGHSHLERVRETSDQLYFSHERGGAPDAFPETPQIDREQVGFSFMDAAFPDQLPDFSRTESSVRGYSNLAACEVGIAGEEYAAESAPQAVYRADYGRNYEKCGSRASAHADQGARRRRTAWLGTPGQPVFFSGTTSHYPLWFTATGRNEHSLGAGT